MVRVGGGWDTLEHYIDKHDPCRLHVAGMIVILLYFLIIPLYNINCNLCREMNIVFLGLTCNC